MTQLSSQTDSHEAVISMIAARGRNGVIGAENDLPWRLKSDMRHFIATTKGKPIIMGRRTWESFPKRPLPGRPNIVVSRNSQFEAKDARVYPSLGTALAAGRAIAAQLGKQEIVVVGGGKVYAEALSLAQKIYLTEVDAEPAGDTVFPAINDADWVETSRRNVDADQDNAYSFKIRVLERISTATIA